MNFVVLHHSGIEEPHFDLLVETSGKSDLATWRLPVWPVDEQVRCQRLRDHRRLYLTYEGTLSQDRGEVRRVDEGTCEVEVAETWTIHLRHRVLRLTPVNGNRWIAAPVV